MLPRMISLFLALLRILFPLDVVARMRELTLWFVAEFDAVRHDPPKLADLANIPAAPAWLEGRIAFTEKAGQLLIHERARQILGLPDIHARRSRDCPPLRATFAGGVETP
jgi:hypothetical protein